MGKLYRTAQGKQVDIEKLRLQNELVPALGNMRVNARGDQLGPGGRILKTREQIVAEQYAGKLDNATAPARSGPIPTKTPRIQRVPDQPIPTSSRKAADQVTEFSPAPVTVDSVAEMPKPKKSKAKAEGGLSKATAKAKETK